MSDAVSDTEKKSATPPVRKADIIPFNTFRRFFNSGIFTDLVLKFSGRSVQVHRNVLSCKSRWFSRALEGPFSEAASKEVEIHDDEPEAVWGMLRHMYDFDALTGDEDEKTMGPGHVAFVRLRRAVSVYIVADKYDVPDLVEGMKKRFEETARERWVDIFIAGKLTELLDVVYADGVATESFKEVSRALVYEHLHTFQDKSPLTLRELLTNHPNLAVDIAITAADPTQIKLLGNKDYQARPVLHDAAQRGDLDEVAKLLDTGVEVDALDSNGETALHLASKYGHAATVRYLVLCGADVNAVSKKFSRGTPMMWAKLRGHRDVKEVLERANALDFPHIDGLDD